MKKFVLYAILLVFCACANAPRTEVSDATLDFFYVRNLLTVSSKNGDLIFDTGSNISWLFSDRININSAVHDSTTINNERKFPKHLIDSLQVGNLTIKHLDVVVCESKNSLFSADSNIIGIIGMDVLTHKYCYFDMETNTLTLSSKRKKMPKPDSEKSNFIHKKIIIFNIELL